MGRRRRTGEGSLLAVLIQAPWQASVVVGVVAFIFFKWMLPSVGGNNVFLKPISAAFASMAWFVAGFFFLIGAVAYLRKPKSRNSQPAAPVRTGRSEPSENRDTTTRGPLGEPRETTSAAGWKETPPKPTQWSIEVIREIEWKRFEDVCQKFYEAKGIKSATTPLGPDGGIDIRLYQDNSGKASSIVQCKAWGDRFVGVKPVRELLGVMVHEKIEKAFFMTSGRFSDDAKEVARSNRITLIDGEMFLMMLKRLPETACAELLSFATSGDYQTPTCPRCGLTMKRVAGKAGRPDFWGCGSYPKCRQSLSMRREM